MDLQYPQAPAYNVPPKAFVCIEHPNEINNLKKGLEMLGGEDAITEVWISSQINVNISMLMDYNSSSILSSMKSQQRCICTPMIR